MRDELRYKLRQSNYQETEKEQIKKRREFLGKSTKVISLDNKLCKNGSQTVRSSLADGINSRQVIVKLQPKTRTYKIYERKPERVNSLPNFPEPIPAIKLTMARTRTARRKHLELRSETSSRANRFSRVKNNSDKESLHVYEWSDNASSMNSDLDRSGHSYYSKMARKAIVNVEGTITKVR